jgi:uncharacterized lipoprotein
MKLKYKNPSKIALLLFLTPLLLASCSYFSAPVSLQSRDKEYLQAKNIPPLRIPPGISSDAFQGYYPISTRDYTQNAQTVSLAPPDLMDK